MQPKIAEASAIQGAIPVAWAARIIARMKALYGAKFSDQWGALDPDEMAWAWAEELAGYSGEEIACGLQACRQRPFPPTLPEFLVLCRPPIDPQVAFHEAVHCLAQRHRGERGDWSHPAIFHAAVAVGAHDMLNATYGQLRTRWGRALSDQLARGTWDPIPDPQQALPAPRKTEASDREAERTLQAIGAANVLGNNGRDPKAWARKILADPKGRTPAVIAMAKRALEQQPEAA